MRMFVYAGPLLGVCRDFFGFLFLYSSAAKWLSMNRFVRSLLLVPHLPHRLARPVGFSIPLVEAVTGSLLIVGSSYGIALTVGLLLLFAGVALLAHRNKQSVPCNCFGGDAAEPLSPKTAVRNITLAAVAAVPALAPSQRFAPLEAIYGLVALLLFLLIAAFGRNRREYRNSFGAQLR
jgi:hypothetical protein